MNTPSSFKHLTPWKPESVGIVPPPRSSTSWLCASIRTLGSLLFTMAGSVSDFTAICGTSKILRMHLRFSHPSDSLNVKIRNRACHPYGKQSANGRPNKTAAALRGRYATRKPKEPKTNASHHNLSPLLRNPRRARNHRRRRTRQIPLSHLQRSLENTRRPLST